MSDLLYNFYTTPRESFDMSDNGGPFGFDIHYALEVDYLIKKYNCDAIIETGTNGGDTAEYLAKQYPNLKILTCEKNPKYYKIANKRLEKYENLFCYKKDSAELIKETNEDFKFPFYYLDAHWYKRWPLKEEIENIKRGIVNVSDVKTHDERYRWDEYDNVICDINFVKENDTPVYYQNSLEPERYDYPSLQMIRRTGRLYYSKGNKKDFFKESKYFVRANDDEHNRR